MPMPSVNCWLISLSAARDYSTVTTSWHSLSPYLSAMYNPADRNDMRLYSGRNV